MRTYKLIDLERYIYYTGTKKEIRKRLNERLVNWWWKQLNTIKEINEHGFYFEKIE